LQFKASPGEWFLRPYLKNSITKNKRVGGVAQKKEWREGGRKEGRKRTSVSTYSMVMDGKDEIQGLRHGRQMLHH
jgi:hypothetical protein